MADEEPDGTARRQRLPTSGRTKSSVRRAREFKQFDQVNLLEVEGADDFDLIHSKRPPVPTPTQQDIPEYSEACEGSTARPVGTSPKKHVDPESSLAKQAAPRKSSFAGSSGKKPPTPRESGRISTSSATRNATTASHAPPTAPAPKRSTLTASHAAPRSGQITPRTSVGRLSTEALETSTSFHRSASVKTPSPTLVAAKEELAAYRKTAEAEITALKETLEKRTAALDMLTGERDAWVMEKEGLLAGMRSGGREVERLTAQCSDLTLAVAELKAASTANSEAADRSVKELEAQVVAQKEHASVMASMKASAEAQIEEVTAKHQALASQAETLEADARQRAEQEAVLRGRITCLLLSAEELGRGAEMERVNRDAERLALRGDVARLTAQVVNLERSLKREQAAAQGAQRALEAAEAVNKRMEAERVRLEENQKNGAASRAAGGAPPGAAVDEMRRELDAAKADKEAIWQEYEMLTQQNDTLQQQLQAFKQTASPLSPVVNSPLLSVSQPISPTDADPSVHAALLAAHKDEVAALQRTITDLQGETAARAGKEQELEELHHSLDELQQAQAELKEGKQTLAEENTRLSAQVNGLAAGRSEDALELADLRREVEVLAKDKESMWDECEALANQVDELRLELTGSQAQSTPQETAELAARVATAEAELAAAQADNAALRAAAEAAATASERVAEMERAVETLRGEKESMWAECDTLTQKLNAAEAAASRSTPDSPPPSFERSDTPPGSATRPRPASPLLLHRSVHSLSRDRECLWKECEALTAQVASEQKKSRDAADAHRSTVCRLQADKLCLLAQYDKAVAEVAAQKDAQAAQGADAVTVAQLRADLAAAQRQVTAYGSASIQRSLDEVRAEHATLAEMHDTALRKLAVYEGVMEGGTSSERVDLPMDSDERLVLIRAELEELGGAGAAAGRPDSPQGSAAEEPDHALRLARIKREMASDGDALPAVLATPSREAVAHQARATPSPASVEWEEPPREASTSSPLGLTTSSPGSSAQHGRAAAQDSSRTPPRSTERAQSERDEWRRRRQQSSEDVTREAEACLPAPTPLTQLLQLARPAGPFGWTTTPSHSPGDSGRATPASLASASDDASSRSCALQGRATKFGFVPPAALLDAAGDPRPRKKSLHMARMARKVEGGQQAGMRKQADVFGTIMDEMVMRKASQTPK
eukprot:TRINITY_DN19267_c0_g1_i1.p1 TRINITY_DN19267_c0_g1~~TRINITY_DN19267_c0_g1_i1.p1  ORF type:complete len:1198 (+),score=371.04 TRINITY_DN19267_c0_g1_i1:45-3596(+)